MSTPARSGFRRLLRAAAIGIAIQLAIGALIGVVAIVFIEDLHSDDHGQPHSGVVAGHALTSST